MADRPLLLYLFTVFLTACAGNARYPFLDRGPSRTSFRWNFSFRLRTKPGGHRMINAGGRLLLVKLQQGNDTVRIRPVVSCTRRDGRYYGRNIRKLLSGILPVMVTGLDGRVRMQEDARGRLFSPDPATVFLFGCLLPPLDEPLPVPESLRIPFFPGNPLVYFKGTSGEETADGRLIMTRSMKAQPLHHGNLRLHVLEITIRQSVSLPDHSLVESRIRFSGRFTIDAVIPVRGNFTGSLIFKNRRPNAS